MIDDVKIKYSQRSSQYLQETRKSFTSFLDIVIYVIEHGP